MHNEAVVHGCARVQVCMPVLVVILIFGLALALVSSLPPLPSPPPPPRRHRCRRRLGQPPSLPPHACTPPPVRASIPAPQLWLQQQLHPQQPRLLQGRGRRRRQRRRLCCGRTGVGRSCGKIWYSGTGVSSCSNNGRNVSGYTLLPCGSKLQPLARRVCFTHQANYHSRSLQTAAQVTTRAPTF